MSGLGIPSGGSSSTKRSFADAFRGHFVQANAAQLQVFRDLAGVDFNLDQTGWTPPCCTTSWIYAASRYGEFKNKQTKTNKQKQNLGTNRIVLSWHQ